jgi:hypothetical protein
MSNCILVVTTLERNVSGRCRTTILLQAHALPRADTFPHGAFFIAVYADPRRDCLPVANSNVFFQIQLDSSKSGLLTRSRMYSSSVELDLTHSNKNYTRQESNLLVRV